jgi:hypothetical protein
LQSQSHYTPNVEIRREWLLTRNEGSAAFKNKTRGSLCRPCSYLTRGAMHACQCLESWPIHRTVPCNYDVGPLGHPRRACQPPSRHGFYFRGVELGNRFRHDATSYISMYLCISMYVCTCVQYVCFSYLLPTYTAGGSDAAQGLVIPLPCLQIESNPLLRRLRQQSYMAPLGI